MSQVGVTVVAIVPARRKQLVNMEHEGMRVYLINAHHNFKLSQSMSLHRMHTNEREHLT